MIENNNEVDLKKDNSSVLEGPIEVKEEPNSNINLGDVKNFFKGFDCEICGRSIYFPLCPNIEIDRFEDLAFTLYSLKCNEKVNLCFDCNKIKEGMIEKEKRSFTNQNFISEEDRLEPIVKRKVKRSDIEKAIECGLIRSPEEESLVI